MSEILFWSAVSIVAYTYVGFPALTWLRSRFWRRPIQMVATTPAVSVLIAAHNEEDSIGDKVRNVLCCDYPADRLQVVVASDGSSDGTLRVLESIHDSRLIVLDLPRAGKAAALNAGVAYCTGEILVFSDANSMFAPESLTELVAPFGDSRVGGVAGDQRYARAGKQSGAEAGERSYWNFDRRMKFWQSASGNVTSATGAIYAIRRTLFRPVPEGVTDDFATSTQVIAEGYRLVFAATAAAYEPVAASSGIEFGRKVRIITRGLRGIVLQRALLNPVRYGFYSVQLFTHKVLRRQMVFPLIVMSFSSVALSGSSAFFLTVTALQILFFGAAAAGWLLHNTRAGRTKLLALPFYFCMVNLACLIGTFRVLTGQRVVLWEPQRAESRAESLAVPTKVRCGSVEGRV